MDKYVKIKNMENLKKERLMSASRNKIIENQLKELRNEMLYCKADLDDQLKSLQRLITENNEINKRTFQTYRLAIIVLLVTNIITILQNLFF